MSTASQSLPVTAVTSARSGQSVVVREMRTCARGASSRVLGRFATPAVIMVCRRLQIASWRAPGAERGKDPPSKISSYGPLMGTSKAVIGAVGKRTFRPTDWRDKMGRLCVGTFAPRTEQFANTHEQNHDGGVVGCIRGRRAPQFRLNCSGLEHPAGSRAIRQPRMAAATVVAALSVVVGGIPAGPPKPASMLMTLFSQIELRLWWNV